MNEAYGAVCGFMFMVIVSIVLKSSDFYHGIKSEDMSTSFRRLGDGQVKNIEVD